MLLADAAIERLVLGVRMDVDETGDHRSAGAVNDPVPSGGMTGAGVIGTEMDDAIAGKGKIDIPAIRMPAPLRVPGDNPGCIPEDGGRHRALPDLACRRERLLCCARRGNAAVPL